MRKFVLRLVFVLATFMAFLGCSSDDGSNCPAGFTGENCDIRMVPSKIKINKIVVTNYPLLNDGDFWDNGEDTSNEEPDLFCIFAQAVPATPLYTSNYITDIGLTEQATFNLSTPIVITQMGAAYSLYIYDYDGEPMSSSQAMAGGSFFVYDTNDTDFPPVITLTDESQPFRVELHVTYEW